ncbi:NUDIX hydrolase [Alkalicoccobacillus murimartini]|uniref:8-oxo-dGTP diphosphatase n=1 Tax=Alkalicoccobacillus murimartini TaxID=171685 RepID=A0ABT9YP95_9BACI|nr:NUDIX hydrolase [Alkalicoccobacillus murimartini]MDQ0208844.1 8-oxo-dGTP diphosphatase [Alkalicoccobacillus murimartini]
MKQIQVVYSFIFDDQSGKVLLVKNKNHNTWSLPGGRVENVETLSEAAIREVREETGLSVEITQVLSLDELFVDGHHAILTTFQAAIKSGELLIQDTETIEEAEWVDLQTANEKIPLYNGMERFLKDAVPYTFHGELDIR